MNVFLKEEQNINIFWKKNKNDEKKEMKTYLLFLVKLISYFFSRQSLSILAINVVFQILDLIQSPPSPEVIKLLIPFLKIQELKIPILKFISRANYIVEDLPLYDPILPFYYSSLHRQLIKISPPERSQGIKYLSQIVSKIEAINFKLINLNLL